MKITPPSHRLRKFLCIIALLATASTAYATNNQSNFRQNEYNELMHPDNNNIYDILSVKARAVLSRIYSLKKEPLNNSQDSNLLFYNVSFLINFLR